MRRRASVVAESDSASIFATPSRPTQITTTATMISTRLKPRAAAMDVSAAHEQGIKGVTVGVSVAIWPTAVMTRHRVQVGLLVLSCREKVVAWNCA